MRLQPTRQQQSGIALLTALLIVAVAVIAATAMLVTHNVAVHRSSNLRFVEQAWWFGLGVENWVGEILRQDREQGEVDHLGEDWAQPVDYLPIEGGFVRGQMVDQQGCFNLNNLDGPGAEPAAAQFGRLFGLLEGADSYAARGVVQATQDWIDKDSDPRIPGGAEDSIYTSFDQPYRAANRPMESPSELLLVKGMTRDLYQALLPHVCVLPSGSAINVNTASSLVLASLAAGMTLADGVALEERRAQQPFESDGDFRDESQLAGRQIDVGLSVNSSYFLLTGQVHVGNGRVNLYSLIFRAPDGTPQLVAHSKDAY